VTAGTLFADLPARLAQELIEMLTQSGGARLERTVSLRHATPSGEWYDQETNEWVVLFRGAAVPRLEDEPGPRRRAPGNWFDIRAHRRHRVE
jgi:cupin 2 domain-containing protein